MDKQISKQQLRRESLRRWSLWGAGGLVLVAAVAALLMSGGKTVKPQDIRLATVDVGELDIMVAANGRVVAEREEILITPVSTRVLQALAQPGDTVDVGTPLLMLDLTEEQTAYDKAQDRHRMSQQQLEQLRLSNTTTLSDLSMQIEVKQMQVKSLGVELSNERRLDSLGSGTGDRVRQAESALRVAQLELRQLQERLGNERRRLAAGETAEQLNVSSIAKDLTMSRRTLEQGRVVSPMRGVLTYLTGEIGSQVSAGQRVAVIADMSRFKITGEVAEGSSQRVSVGADVEVRVGREVLTGRVTNVNPQATNGTVKFVVALDQPADKRLRSGQGTELYVSYGYRANVTRIPRGPFFTAPGNYRLFVQTADGKLERRDVVLGDSSRDHIEVKSGLNPGDRVVITDMKAYENYDKLEVKA